MADDLTADAKKKVQEFWNGMSKGERARMAERDRDARLDYLSDRLGLLDFEEDAAMEEMSRLLEAEFGRPFAS